MKILSIRLKNLASLAGEHFIDFESEPLASAGLIAIVGKTGAGKSTILDAMCLALFNKMPRLKESDGKLVDVDGSELLTNSPLTVLRRGSAHGFAELCFTAQDQKRYLVRWEIKRARENVAGKLQSVQRSLKCLTDGMVLADKPTAVANQVQQLTQLSFEQFTRAVLLAQSEVTAFLKARDSERGELLEYLTNSAIFAKIGQLAFEKTKEITAKRKQLESTLGTVELLSDEEFIVQQENLNTSQQQLKQLDVQKQQHLQSKNWFDDTQKREQAILLKQQQVLEQSKIYDALKPERELLNQLAQFADIRPQVFQHKQTQDTLQQLEPNIEQKQLNFKTLEHTFNQLKQQYTQAEKALEEIQVFDQTYQLELKQIATDMQTREMVAEQFKQIRQKIQQLVEQQQPALQKQQHIEQQLQQQIQQQKLTQDTLKRSNAFTGLDAALPVHLQQLEQFIQTYQTIENNLGDIHQAELQLQNDQEQIKQLEQEFGLSEQLQAKIEQQRMFNQDQANRSHLLANLQQKLNDYAALENEIFQQQVQLKSNTELEQVQSEKTTQAEKELLEAQAEREKLQKILQQQRLLHAENIEQLRENLSPNEPCLVCGSTEHPYRDNETVVSKALYELQQQQEQRAVQAEQQLFQTWQAHKQQLTTVHANISQLTQSLAQQQVKLSLQQHLLTRHAQDTSITLDFQLNTKELSQHLQQCIDLHIQQTQENAQNLNQLTNVQKNQSGLYKNIQNLSTQLTRLQQHQKQLDPILACLNKDEQQLWASQRLSFSQKLFSRLNERQTLLKQTDTQVKQIDASKHQLELNQNILNNLDAQLKGFNTEKEGYEQQGKECNEHATQLIAKISGSCHEKPNDWLLKHEQNRQSQQQQYKNMKQIFESARQNFGQQKNELEALTTKQTEHQNNLTQLDAEIDAWSVQHPNIASSEFLNLLAISSQREQQIRSELQHAETAKTEAEATLKTVQAQLDEQMKSKPNIALSELQELIQNTQMLWQQYSEQRDQANVKLELHQQNVVRQQKYLDDIQTIQKEEHRWSKISSVIGDAKGKEFRDFAQQFNLDILLEYANQQLAMLSQRYTLKRLENSLSLAIIDHDMDGEIRSVASLSGGESFLTALAISLAIANMASGSMKIESLFIDEGFGTLDASSLHMVMNALDQLQSQGRKVVLISHIQEMHERIPVQIQVQPLGSGSSRIEVVG